MLPQRVGFDHALAPMCALMGRIARREGDEAEATTWFRRGVDTYRRLGDIVSAELLAEEAAGVRRGSSGIGVG